MRSFLSRRITLALVLASSLALPLAAHASTPTLPDLGVDIAAYVSAMTTKIGTIIAAGIGLTAAVVVVYKGVRYFRRAG